MLFNSYIFVFGFLPAVLVGYFAIRSPGLRLALVVGASYVFYAHAEWWFPILMVSVTAVSFAVGLVLARLPDGGRRRLVLALGIAACLSVLGVFKYAHLLAHWTSGIVSLITAPGLPGFESLTRGIILPAGISFYVFEAISYMVDVHRGTVPAERNALRYAFFISYFPHLIAGPIVRYAKLGPQLRTLHRFDAEQFRSGLFLFSLGLTKKVVLADGIGNTVDIVLRNPASLGFFNSWSAMIGYSFQIYFDFSGYTDMALGLARMMGFELPWNFDRPYRAASPSEFWRRWHVTLSTWLRDYLYIPLGGNRKGPVRRDANLLVTMALGGLWHGASLNFLFWGLWHGGLLVGQNRLSALPFRLGRVLSVIVTFLLVTIGWVFFRLRDLGDIGSMLAGMAGAHGIGHPIAHLLPYIAVGAVLMWRVPEEWSWRLPDWGWIRIGALALLTVYTIVALNDTQRFLYFQF